MRTDFLVLCVGIAGFSTPILTMPGAVYAQSCNAPSCTSCGTAPRSTQAPRSAARGIYSRSPDSGERVGESNSMGIRGFGIRLPSISLEMPELRLPSINRYRRDAYMITDSAHAPYIDNNRALEFNPVGPDRETAAPDRSAESPRFTPRSPSCDAPVPRCDAPAAAVPGVDERAQRRDVPDSRNADLQQLREQAISLQKAIDSIANGSSDMAVPSERAQLQQKDREIAELRMELQRMQSTVEKAVAQSVLRSQSATTRTEQRTPTPNTTSNLRQVSTETQKNTRVGGKPVAQNGGCNGPKCQAKNSQSRNQQDDGFEAPVVNKTYTASRLSNLRPSSILGR